MRSQDAGPRYTGGVSSQYWKPTLVFLLGFAIRAAIIGFFPVIWGGDTILRLFDRAHVITAHQLPVFQLLIAGVSWISTDPILVRGMTALIGAYAGVAFYWVAGDLFGAKYAFPGALLFATQPMLLALSTVPYQETLMVAALLSAFHYFYTNRMWAASAWFAIACLTRYEAWAACPVFVLAHALRDGKGWRSAVKAGVLFGWAPAMWIAARQGLTSPGHFVIEWPSSIWRLHRYLYLGWIVAKFTQVSVLLLAAAGIWSLCRNYRNHAVSLWMQVAFVSLFLLSVLFSAHGTMPDPERFVTSREAVIPICFVMLVAVAGLHRWAKWSGALAGLSVVLGIAGAVRYVQIESARPDVELAYRVARFLDNALGPGERALILARPTRESDARLYLETARRTGGSEGLRAAQQELSGLAATPPNYQRVVVHSRTARERLLPPNAGCGEWVAVWSDHPNAGRELRGAVAVQVFTAGDVSVTIIRRGCE